MFRLTSGIIFCLLALPLMGCGDGIDVKSDGVVNFECEDSKGDWLNASLNMYKVNGNPSAEMLIETETTAFDLNAHMALANYWQYSITDTKTGSSFSISVNQDENIEHYAHTYSGHLITVDTNGRPKRYPFNCKHPFWDEGR